MIFYLIILRVYLQALALLGLKLITFKPSFPYWETVLAKLGPNWLWLWGNFDGAHYIKLAQFGYKEAFTQAFFPLYPILMRFLNYITHNGLISGLIISHLAVFGFIYFFVKLGRIDFGKITINWSLAFLLLFPTSFFLFSVYTEALFLFLVVLSFYLARKKNFLLAALIAGLASATRFVGIFLLPAILWEYWQKKETKTWLFYLSIIGLSSSGLLLYLNFLQRRFGDLMIFVSSQPNFGAGRQVDKLIMIYQVVWRYLKMFVSVSPQNDIYPVLVFEFGLSVIFLGLIIYALVKKLRTSYLLFIIPTFFLPTLTGSFLSMPRFLLTGFPIFYLLGNIKNKVLKTILLTISTILLTWAFLRFSRGYWLS
ncbi:MAG: hypothetical protein ABIJ43_04065 [Candidatus Beckwithbacteria bacterium]